MEINIATTLKHVIAGKRIVIICGAGIVGGKERQTIEYMLELRKRMHDVYCITSDWASPDFKQLLTDNNIPFASIRLGFISMTISWSALRMTLHQAMYIPSLFWSYWRIIRTWKPCMIVHTNFHHILLLLPLLRSPRQVFHVHDTFQVNTRFRRLFKLFNARIDKFIGVSEFVCRNISDLGIPREKIELIYNGIKSPTAILRNENPVPIIGIAGQVGHWKGHHILVEALGTLLAFDWKLQIVGQGDPEYIYVLEEKITALNMSNRVSFVGHRTGLENIYQDLDIVCVPSLREPFGLVAAEPGFFGIPVIVSDSGGLPEIVIDGLTGLVVPAGDATALAVAIRSLLTNPEHRRKYGDKAREYVKNKFSIANSGLRLEEVLDRLCDS